MSQTIQRALKMKSIFQEFSQDIQSDFDLKLQVQKSIYEEVKTQGEVLKKQTEHFYEVFKSLSLELKVPLKLNFNELRENCQDYQKMIQVFCDNADAVKSKLGSFKSKELFELEIVKKS